MINSRSSLQPLVALLTLGLIACSGSAEHATPLAAQEVVVTVTPDSAALAPTEQQTFAATVTGTADVSVTWSVAEGAPGGGVTSNGLYTAPGTAGTYHVVVRSNADSTKSATATITVTAPPPPPPVVAVTIDPTPTTVVARGTKNFTCTVTGSSDTACTWSVQETSGGTVTSGTTANAGVYTAPATAGTYHVIAKSHADPTKSAVATVTVTAPPVSVAITISPNTASVDACKTYTFSAPVTGSTNTAVTWSVTESTGGSVSTSGTSTTSGVYTAPATGGTYHVVATSQADPTKSASATVTVTERIVSISVSPSAPPAVAPGGTIQFTATVTTTCGSFTTSQAVAAN